MDSRAAKALYELDGPTRWAAGTPDKFSFSSLRSIEECPMRWQLERSRYAQWERFPQKPNVAALRGSIVHETLDVLFRRLSFAGLPHLGTAEFRAVVCAVEPRQRISDSLEAAKMTAAKHPRNVYWPRDLDTNSVFDDVTRFFRREYPKAQETGGNRFVSSGSATWEGDGETGLAERLELAGVLTEEHLAHSSLPFHGVVDLVRMAEEGPVLADFKTGKRQPYHTWQILLYALLWYRNTGQVPARAEVIYPSDSVSIELTEATLLDAEDALVDKISAATAELTDPPARPRLGDHCTYCDVKQYCDAYWENASRRESQWIDIEVQVVSATPPTAMWGQTRDGRRFLLVSEEDIAVRWGPFQAGERLRIRAARVLEREDEEVVVELTSYCEVFRVKRATSQ